MYVINIKLNVPDSVQSDKYRLINTTDVFSTFLEYSSYGSPCDQNT